MRIFEVATSVVLVGLCLAAPVRAQEDRGLWRSASKEALVMTGDITIGEAKVTLNFVTFPLAQIRRLKPVEVSAVFDADVNAGIEGTLYRLRIPGAQRIAAARIPCAAARTRNGWRPT